MNVRIYEQYLEQYVREAVRTSDGTARGIYERLAEMRVQGVFVMHKVEKQRALADARQAFDEHRHWPVEIILSHLGIKIPLG